MFLCVRALAWQALVMMEKEIQAGLSWSCSRVSTLSSWMNDYPWFFSLDPNKTNHKYRTSTSESFTQWSLQSFLWRVYWFDYLIITSLLCACCLFWANVSWGTLTLSRYEECKLANTLKFWAEPRSCFEALQALVCGWLHWVGRESFDGMIVCVGIEFPTPKKMWVLWTVTVLLTQWGRELHTYTISSQWVCA